MKNLVLLVISFLIGVGAVFAFSLINKQNNPPKQSADKKTSEPNFKIESPPSESLKGLIASRSGTLLWESRIATAPAEIGDNIQIQQGERLISEQNSKVTVNFDQAGFFELSENSDLAFIQTLPAELVVEQKKGKIRYTVNGKFPLSIKIRNALISKKSGVIEIALTEDDPAILISTIRKTAVIGFNDSDNISQLFNLREGQIYEYNSEERTTINVKNK